METKPTWSFSSIKTFEQCPKKYYHTKIAKDYKEDFNTDSILYGNQFHEAAEEYVGGKVETLDPRFSFTQSALDKLKNMEGEKLCEYKMGLTANLEPCGFFDKDVWFRGVSDLTIVNRETCVAKVIDYKTGKSAKYADKGQLELMALATFKHFPEVKVVKGGLLFVVCNAFIKDTYTIEQEPELWKKWLTQYAQVEKATEVNVWNPKPTGLCRAHCVVLECPHNGRQ
jgi:RecB family exonuclease